MALLELEEVAKHYGGLAAVDGVTVKADDGEILAIVGPNGAGKSTLLKLIVGLETPTRGTVRFAGQDITGLASHNVRKLGIAMVQQTPRTFPSMTVLENAAIGAMFGSSSNGHAEEPALKEGNRMLELVGLADRRHDHVGNLNLHEQRFLELARAIAGQPRLLVLDEVMAGLNDTELEASIEIFQTIRSRFDMTIILVEHVMKAVLSLAERTVVLNFGKILTEGTPKDVMRHPTVIEAYLGKEIQHA